MTGTMPAFFADTISRVGVAGGCVRIEFSLMHPPAAQGEPSRSEVVMNLAMPLEGFINAFAAQENLMRQLQEAGVVVRREAGAANTDAAVPAGNGGKPAKK